MQRPSRASIRTAGIIVIILSFKMMPVERGSALSHRCVSLFAVGDPALISADTPPLIGTIGRVEGELSVCSREDSQGSKHEPEPPRRPVEDVLAILWCIFWILVALGWMLHGGDLPLPVRG
jgi:hypothetical protein